jgi:hypothetical protein
MAPEGQMAADIFGRSYKRESQKTFFTARWRPRMLSSYPAPDASHNTAPGRLGTISGALPTATVPEPAHVLRADRRGHASRESLHHLFRSAHSVSAARIRTANVQSAD